MNSLRVYLGTSHMWLTSKPFLTNNMATMRLRSHTYDLNQELGGVRIPKNMKLPTFVSCKSFSTSYGTVRFVVCNTRAILLREYDKRWIFVYVSCFKINLRFSWIESFFYLHLRLICDHFNRFQIADILKQ